MPTAFQKNWASFREMLIPKRQSRGQLLRDAGITFCILAIAAAVCTVLTHMGDSDSAVPMVFVLAVLLVARLTDGFLFSLVATVVSVISVNYAFTYPYFAFNFTITGYPLTFLTMFAVSLVVGMLTDRVKLAGTRQTEAEKEKMKANLLRSVSHDLRTPLTSIIGSSSAVLENYDKFSDDVKKDLIGHVRDDAQWLVRLVENILSITRFNEGAVKIDKVPQAAEEIAAEAVSKFKKAIRYAARARQRAGRAADGADGCDAHRAGAHQSDGKRRSSRERRNGNRTARPPGGRIGADSACWIMAQASIRPCCPNCLKKCFRMRANCCGDGRRSMGIGLSVCMSIVRAHGGTMKAENRATGGACVSFALPMEEE